MRVRVRAASVNALDWRRVRADPFVIRLGGEFRRPKVPGLGVDAAGVIDAVGPGEADLRVGDEVFGLGAGSFAECTVGRIFVRKPANITFEEAAAVPVAGTTALQAVRDKGRRSGRSARPRHRRRRRRRHVRGADRPRVRRGGDGGHEHGQGRAWCARSAQPTSSTTGART